MSAGTNNMRIDPKGTGVVVGMSPLMVGGNLRKRYRWRFLFCSAIAILLGWFVFRTTGVLQLTIDYITKLKMSAEGYPIVVCTDTIDLGVVKAGHEYRFAFQVENVTNQDVVVHLSQSTCGCYASNSFPLAVPPHSTRPIEYVLKIDPKIKPGDFVYRSRLLVDTPSPELNLNVRATVQ